MSGAPLRCKLGAHRWSIWGPVIKEGRMYVQQRYCLSCACAMERVVSQRDSGVPNPPPVKR